MKKIFFSLAAVLFAATSFAQGIVLERQLNGWVMPSSTSIFGTLYGNRPFVEDFDECFYKVENGVLTWWDETYTQHTVAVGEYGSDYETGGVVCTRNIFTTDNRMCFLCVKDITNAEGYFTGYHFRVFDELGTIICDINHDNIGYYNICFMFGEYKLVLNGGIQDFDTHDYSSKTTYIYSLPGAGKTATDNEIVQSAPRRNRKYIQNAQVLVEENDRTYNMTGARVK